MNMNYMMEEDIKSQGKIVEDLINKYIVNYCVLMDIPLRIKQIKIIASGSSFNAGLFGKYFLENISQTETSIEYASEFANSSFLNHDVDCLHIFISQSGNSTDVIQSIEKVKKRGVKTLCITNNEKSKLYELSDFKLLLGAKEERAIAATKTFSATVVMMWLVALKIAQNKHLDIAQETKNVYSIKQNIENTIEDIENLDYAAKLISKQKSFSLVGLGAHYPIAKEAALKIKEINYIDANAYPMGEFVHGHFAILNKSKVLLSFLFGEVSEQEKKLLDKILTTYKPKTIILTDDYEDYNSDMLLKFPKANSKIANIVCATIVVQLLALKIAYILKRNPDKPKGLTKVVQEKG